MGKKTFLNYGPKKKKEDYNLLSPSKKKIIFSKKIFLFLLNLQKKTFPILYKKEKKKRNG